MWTYFRCVLDCRLRHLAQTQRLQSLNRRIEAYLFCMGSLAESAIAYRAECTLWGGVEVGAKRGEKKKAGSEGGGGWWFLLE